MEVSNPYVRGDVGYMYLPQVCDGAYNTMQTNDKSRNFSEVLPFVPKAKTSGIVKPS